MQDAHIPFPPRMWNYATWGRTSDRVEVSIPQKKKRCVLETRPLVRQGQRHYYGDVTSINQFVAVFQWKLLKTFSLSQVQISVCDSHSCVSFCLSKQSIISIGFWSICNWHSCTCTHFTQFVVPFWYTSLTRRRWLLKFGLCNTSASLCQAFSWLAQRGNQRHN